MAAKEKPAIAPLEGPLINKLMTCIIQDITAIGKNNRNDSQNYIFRGIDDMYAGLFPIFARHGVVCLPSVKNLVREQRPGKDATKVTSTSILTMGYKFIAPDGSFVEADTIGEGSDHGDKATAKAMSMCQKYLLIQTFLVPTYEIEDGDREPVIDGQEEVARLREAQRQEAALQEKREGLQQQLEGQQAPAGVQAAAEAPPKKAVEAPATEPAPKPPGRRSKPAAASQEAPQATPEAPVTQPKAQEPASNLNPHLEHVITALNHPHYTNKRVGDLTLAQLELLSTNWSEKSDFQAGIEADPNKIDLRTHLRAALKLRREQKK